jgi:DNA-binding HxlR family transcriptional regulator
MKRGITHVPDRCRPATEVLQLIGDKWSVLIVISLAEGPKRFSEIRRAIPAVSQRMLTLTLRGLERDGMVSRTVTPSIPPRVDYELTKLGHSLKQPIWGLGQWATDNHAAILRARSAYDAAQSPKRKAG